MEKNNASATDVVNILRKFQNNIIERKDAKFIPLGSKKVLNTLTDEETNILKIEEDFKLFYERCIAYIRLWENSFGDASTFFWVDENEIKWDHFLRLFDLAKLPIMNSINRYIVFCIFYGTMHTVDLHIRVASLYKIMCQYIYIL